ncbi:MAG: hypothetical protein JRM73_03800 [Nitrososphaerota archaeon]|nr:hypothetical protein [Nitrososphaerota archaeon]
MEDLQKNLTNRDPQVKEGLELYLGLWNKAVEKGIVSRTDDVDHALAKLEEKGGLVKAAEG